MESINMWCRLISAVSVISAVFILVLPEGRIKKAYKTFLSLILIFSFIYPLNVNKGAVSISDFSSLLSYEESSFEITDYENLALITAAEGETKRYIEEKTQILGISGTFDVECGYDGNKITLESIEVKGEVSVEDINAILGITDEISNGEAEVIINGEKYE